jgi:hypothetical protein
MDEILEVASLEFTADVAGAFEETRISAKVATSAISAIAKVITALL